MADWRPRPLMASLTNPFEYDGLRRRPFWEVIAGRAARGSQEAVQLLAQRECWRRKVARYE